MGNASQLHRAVANRVFDGNPYLASNPYFMHAETIMGGATVCSFRLLGDAADGSTVALNIRVNISGFKTTSAIVLVLGNNPNGLGYWNPVEVANMFMSDGPASPDIGTPTATSGIISYDVASNAGGIDSAHPAGSTYTAPV